MANQQFCLRWNNHQNNLLDVFGNLLSSEHFVDVTLACDGKLLKAHKMVLSACSTFFQEIFLNNPCKHPVVFIKDVKYSELHAIVEFMYRGEVNISQDQLSSLLKTAEALKVKGLAEVGGAEQSNESSENNPSTSTIPVSTSNNNSNNNSNDQQPRTTSQVSYPPSPKRAKTRRFETRPVEVCGKFTQQFSFCIILLLLLLNLTFFIIFFRSANMEFKIFNDLLVRHNLKPLLMKLFLPHMKLN